MNDDSASARFINGPIGGEVMVIRMSELRGRRYEVPVMERTFVQFAGSLPSTPQNFIRRDVYEYEGRDSKGQAIMRWVDPVPPLREQLREANKKLAAVKEALECS